MTDRVIISLLTVVWQGHLIVFLAAELLSLILIPASPCALDSFFNLFFDLFFDSLEYIPVSLFHMPYTFIQHRQKYSVLLLLCGRKYLIFSILVNILILRYFKLAFCAIRNAASFRPRPLLTIRGQFAANDALFAAKPQAKEHFAANDTLFAAKPQANVRFAANDSVFAAINNHQPQVMLYFTPELPVRAFSPKLSASCPITWLEKGVAKLVAKNGGSVFVRPYYTAAE